MTVERKVEASPLFPREVGLFCHAYNAWEHFVKHVLDAGEGEPWSWGVLIPALQAALDAGQRADLHDQGRKASPDDVPADLATLWPAFLELVATAVEKGTSLRWYYEGKQQPGDGPYTVFAPSGVLACLDEDRVRTGFFPFKGELPAGTPGPDRPYWLFFKCWEKVQRRYQRAQQQGQIVTEEPAFRNLMQKVPGPAEWERLK
jgi:hypothetical protein